MTKQGEVTTYENRDGDRLNFFQIAMRGAKEGYEIEETENGWMVNGEEYVPVSEE